MDAGRLAFANNSFDAAAVMYVMTVVPDPAAVMAEIWRVLRPGGTAIVVNHFSRERGLRAEAEHGLARFSRRLGWHPVFPLKTVTGAPGFRLVEANRSAAVRAVYASAAAEGSLALPWTLALTAKPVILIPA